MNPRANQWHWLYQPIWKIEIHAASRLRTLLSLIPEMSRTGLGYLLDSPLVVCFQHISNKALNEESSPTSTEHPNTLPASWCFSLIPNVKVFGMDATA
jgi:hypothetical protein